MAIKVKNASDDNDSVSFKTVTYDTCGWLYMAECITKINEKTFYENRLETRHSGGKHIYIYNIQTLH